MNFEFIPRSMASLAFFHGENHIPALAEISLNYYLAFEFFTIVKVSMNVLNHDGCIFVSASSISISFFAVIIAVRCLWSRQVAVPES